MSHGSQPSGDCCESCKRGETCEGKPPCLRAFATGLLEPAIVPSSNTPGGAEFRHIYRPNYRAGLAPYLRHFSFVHSTSAGVGVAVRIEVSLVPPDTALATAELVKQRVILVGQVLGAPSPGVFSLIADREPGLVIPLREDQKPWWVFLRVGTVAVPPAEESSHSLQFGYQPIFWGGAH